MITEKKLLDLGFHKRRIEENIHDFIKPLDDNWSLEVTGNLVELVHNGHAVMLKCDNEQKLEQLIQVL